MHEINTLNINVDEIIKLIYNMSESDFIYIENKVKMILNTKSIRLCNAINKFGIQRFCVEYLFKEDFWILLNIPNLGKKSATEFFEIKDEVIRAVILGLVYVSDTSQYACSSTKDIQEEAETPVIDTPKSELLSPLQQHKLSYVYNNRINTFSIRTKNCLGKISCKNFIDRFIFNNEDILNIRNLGVKCKEELLPFLDEFTEMIDKMLEENILNTNHTNKEEESRTINCYKYKNIYGELFDDYAQNIYMNNNRLPVFYLLANYFLLSDDRNLDILIHSYPILFGREQMTLNELSDKHNVSRERVRQIRDYLIKLYVLNDLEEINDCNKILIFKTILKEDWTYYNNIFIDKDIIRDSDINEILFLENSTITTEYAINILCKVLNFSLLKSEELGTSSFAINEYLLNYYDFFNFINRFKNYKESIKDSVIFKVEDLLLTDFIDLWVDFEPLMQERIETIINYILIEIFNLHPDPITSLYTIETTYIIKPIDFMYELLKSTGVPMNINNVHSEYCKKYPDVNLNVNSFRSQVQKDVRIASIGKNSFYALREWKHVQFGTIRDLIVKYLAPFPNPQHIDSIVDYVIGFYDTSEKNIRSTMSSGNQFVAFENGYFGLADKEYPDNYTLLQPRISFEENIKRLECFIVKNEHFPFSSNSNNEESRLYRWWYRVTSSETLTDDKKEMVQRILYTYKDYPIDAASYQHYYMVKKYTTFIENNYRRPSAKSKEEVKLSKWFSRLQQKFYDDRLNERELDDYIKICNMI